MLLEGSDLQGRAYSFSLQITRMWEPQPFQLGEIQLFVQAGVCSCLTLSGKQRQAQLRVCSVQGQPGLERIQGLGHLLLPK